MKWLRPPWDQSSHFLFPETRESPTLKPETLQIGLVQFTKPISGGFPSRVGVQMMLRWSHSWHGPTLTAVFPKARKSNSEARKPSQIGFVNQPSEITMNLLLTPYFKPFLFYRLAPPSRMHLHPFTHPPQHLAVARIVNLIFTQVIPVIHTIGARYAGWPWWYEQPLVYPSNGMEDQDRFPKLMGFGFCERCSCCLERQWG